MDFPVFLKLIHLLALASVLFGGLGYLRLVTTHMVQRPMNERVVRELQISSALMIVGMLAFCFSSGGLFAAGVLTTDVTPPVFVLALRAITIAMLAAGAVFLHVVARPRLIALPRQPLLDNLSFNLMMGLTSSAGVLFASWVMWVVSGLNTGGTTELGLSDYSAAYTLLVLVLWLGLASPLLFLRGLRMFAGVPATDQHQFRTDPVGEFEIHAVPTRQYHRPAVMAAE